VLAKPITIIRYHAVLIYRLYGPDTPADARARNGLDAGRGPADKQRVAVPDSALTDLPPLDYPSIRALVRTGDLLLCSGRQAFSHAIRWATNSPFSHIAMLVRLEEIDRVMVLESIEKIGVRAVPFRRFLAGNGRKPKPFPGRIVIARHADFADKATPERLAKMGEFAADRLGAPFSSGEIAKIAMRIAASGLGMKLPRQLLPDDEFICSEYLAECYRHIGIEIPWDGRGFIAPSDFAKDAKVEAIGRVAVPGTGTK
jgi:hypothetical protein